LYEHDFNYLKKIVDGYKNIVPHTITISLFLKYLGLKKSYIVKVLGLIMNIDFLEFILQCSEMNYDPEMTFLCEEIYPFKCTMREYCKDIHPYMDRILMSDFPTNFKNILLKKLVDNFGKSRY
jgi:hypothetical protein